MRKSLFIGLVAILGLIGCSRNQEIDVPDANLSLFARTESPADIKTVVESGVHVYWEPGDEIAVFMGEKSAKFTTDITAASGTATFKGTFGDTSWPEELDLWAVYPFSEDATFDGETITAVLPPVQVARAGSFGKDMNLAIAHSTGTTLQFYNVGGGVCFTVKEDGIKRLSFENCGEGYISGKIRIGFSGGVPIVEEIIEGSKIVSVSLPDDAAFEPGVWYYFSAIPGQLQEGFRIQFSKDGSYAGKVFSKDVTIIRSIFGRLSELDDGMAYFSDEEVSPIIEMVGDIVGQCVTDDMDAKSLIENYRQQIESSDLVQSVEIGEAATTVLLKTGKELIYPYNYDSLFDYEDEEIVENAIFGLNSHYNLAPTRATDDYSDPAQDAKWFDADVYIFNLFSEDSKRETQNKLMADVKWLFQQKGKTVCYLGLNNFTAKNVSDAVTKNKIIFFSTLGSEDGRLICTGEISSDQGGWHKDIGILSCQYLSADFVVCKFDKKYNGVMFQALDVKKLLKDYKGPLVYFASCNTMKNDWGKAFKGKNIVGWSGVNRIGQAYAPIIADYMATWNKTYTAFHKDFSIDNIVSDPLVKGTQLVHLGSGWIPLEDSEFKDNGRADRATLLVISKPIPGTCTKSTKKYTVDLLYKNPGNIVTDGLNNTYEDGNKYNLAFDSFSGHYFKSDFLRIKDDKLSYTGQEFSPGVWRIATIQRVPNDENKYIHDWTYLILSKKFQNNDGEEIDQMPSPLVETLLASQDNSGFFLAGDVINRSLSGLETGFQYWKKGESANKNTISSTATYEGYFGTVLSDASLNGEYEVRAYAIDEDGQIGYGDVMSFSSSAIPPDGTTNKIYYTTSDGSIVTPYSSVCSANIVSNIYSDGKGVITFDGAITSINKEAFWLCSTLTSITIPEGVKSIGDFSFYGCTSLTSIALPEGVTSIGCGAFYECSSLPSITIPKSVTRIGGDSLYGAFQRCESLTSITIPEGVTTIDDFTFHDCWYLKDVSIPEGVTRIGGWAFWACGLSYLKLPKSLRVIGEEAFLNSGLTSITIPEGVTSIEAGAFMDGNYLTSIKILSAVPPSGGADMFRDSNCPIYVPAGSVEAYKSAEFWNVYADRIKPIGGGAFDDDDTYWVDLGLSVKWAKYNLGAMDYQDPGDYFAWGEITPNKSSFSWETYRWCNGNENSLTKYSYGDGNTSLDYEDDPAYDRTGGNWRMPTEAEWRELIENCSWSFNGVEIVGYSNVVDSYISFPLGGKKDGTEWINYDSVGYYWTASLSPFASMGCIGTTTATPDTGYLERYIGLPIRPVYNNK